MKKATPVLAVLLVVAIIVAAMFGVQKNDLNDEAAALETALTASETQAATLTGDLEALKAEAAASAAKATELETQATEVTAQMNASTAKATELESTVVELTAKTEASAARVTELEADAAELTASNETAAAELAQTNAALETANADLAAANAALETAANDLAATKAAIESAVAELTATNEELAAVKAAAEAAAAEAAAAEAAAEEERAAAIAAAEELAAARAAYADVWVLTDAEAGGVPVDTAALGLEMSITLSEAGMCVLNALGTEETGIWMPVENGIVISDSETTDTLVLENGKLVMEQDGVKLIFTRQSEAEAEAAAETADEEEYAIPLSNLTMDAFYGDWNFAYAELNGMVYEAADVGMEMRISLADGKGHCEMSYDDGTSEAYDAVLETEEVSGLGTVVYFLIVDANGATDGSGLVLLLYEGDELVWYAYSEELTIFYCFERAAE